MVRAAHEAVEPASRTAAPAPLATPRTYAGLFLVALATLMYEVLLTRIFSVTMWYHFAFVAISIAMFGTSVAALVIQIRPAWFPPEKVHRQLARWSLLFPIAIVLSLLTQLSIPFRIHPSIVAIYAIVFTFVCVAVPFVVGGLAVCLTLTRFPARVGSLYAADLAGAAAGCVLLPLLLKITDGPTAAMAISALAAAGACCFAVDSGLRRMRRAAGWLTVALALFAAVHTVLVWRQFPALRILYVKAGFEARPLYEKWNSYSRIRVEGDPTRLEKPYTWGRSTAMPDGAAVRQLHMDIDVAAGTVMTQYTGKPEELEHLKYDVTNVAYFLRQRPNTLIVGAGGGRDVLSALAFGARSILAVELNGDILDTVNRRFGDFTGHLDHHLQIRFVNDEARSFIAREGGRHDLVQISLIDTWAATAAGAFVLSENALYTVEAWTTFIRRLSPDGLLSVSRWYFHERPGEVYRLTSLASAALERAGVSNPRPHLVIIRNIRPDEAAGGPDGIGTLLLSRRPFTDADLRTLEDVARRLQYEIVLSPATAADDTFGRLASGGEPMRDLVRTYPINIAPPTDDSPFFFQLLRLGDVMSLDLLRHGKSTHNMEAVMVLALLLACVGLMAIVAVALPLVGSHRLRADRTVAGLLTYFAAIGFGFMLVETSQMQRLIVVLGHPTYGLVVVLFSLLLSSGLGSLLTQRIPDRALTHAIRTRLGLLVILLFIFGAVTPAVGRAVEDAATPVRIAVSVVLLFPPGLMMGAAFPIGMRLAARTPLAVTPWLWGVNTATSVAASALGVAIAIGHSISSAFWTGFACYVIAFASGLRTATRLSR